MDRTRLDTLTQKITRLGFQQWSLITEEQLLQGSCFAFAVLWRFVLESHPRFLVRFMQQQEWFCLETDDRRLAISLTRLLKVAFAYQSPLSPIQVIQDRFFAQKAQMLLDSIGLLHREERRCVPQPHMTSSVLSQRIHSRCPRHLPNDSEECNATKRFEALEKRRRELNQVVRETLP
jgi:hypothetical protein